MQENASRSELTNASDIVLPTLKYLSGLNVNTDFSNIRTIGNGLDHMIHTENTLLAIWKSLTRKPKTASQTWLLEFIQSFYTSRVNVQGSYDWHENVQGNAVGSMDDRHLLVRAICRDSRILNHLRYGPNPFTSWLPRRSLVRQPDLGMIILK